MSRKYVAFVLIGFFMAVSVAVTVRLMTPSPKQDTRVQELAIQLELERMIVQAYTLKRTADLTFYGIAGVLSSVCVSVVIVAFGVHRAHVRRSSVHPYTIGGSVIQVHHRDLSLAAPVAMGLITAEQLRQTNEGMNKAFDLTCRMADIQTQQIRALMSGGRALKALPETTDADEPRFSGHIPTFRELVQTGELARGKPMILGYINGQPRRGSFLDIYSAAVAGESGSGKTSTMLFLIGSAILAAPGRFVGIDPHYPHPKSLGFKTKPLWQAGLMRMATFKDDMLAVLQDVEQTIDCRLKQTDTDDTPVVLVIDELAFLSKTPMGPKIAHTMERISTEGRKCAVYMLASSQTWLVSRTGESSVVRDTLTSAYVHRIKPKQANLLLQDRDEAEKVKRFVKQAGEALLCPVGSESEIVRMPYTADADMQLVIDLVNRPGNRQPVDYVVDQASQRTGLVTVGSVDLVDQVQMTLKNEGDFSALVQSTGLDKAYVSRILNRKQNMSRNAEDRLRIWLTQYQNH